MYFSYSGWQFSQLKIDSVGGFLHGNLVPALQEYVGAFGAVTLRQWATIGVSGCWIIPDFSSALSILTPLKPSG